MYSFFQGLVMGLAYVAPIGMQNLFVINAALNESPYRAIGTACIVLCFDAALSLSCFFGIGTLMNQYAWLEQLIFGVGSLVVCFMGIQVLRAKGELHTETAQSRIWSRKIGKACVVTWFNPQAIIDGTMLLGATQALLAEPLHVPFMAGVIAASCLWFLGLTTFISRYKNHMNTTILRGINSICGLLLFVYGLTLLHQFMQRI